MIYSKHFTFVLKTHEQFSFLILRKLATMNLPTPEIEDFFCLLLYKTFPRATSLFLFLFFFSMTNEKNNNKKHGVQKTVYNKSTRKKNGNALKYMCCVFIAIRMTAWGVGGMEKNLSLCFVNDRTHEYIHSHVGCSGLRKNKGGKYTHIY